MDIIYTVFKRKKINFSKLIPFGFIQEQNTYKYKKILSESEFIFTVKITEEGNISAEIIDPAFNEPYTLHLADGAAGSFVGKVKMQYEETLTEIAEKCFEPDVFKSRQTKELIEYVRQRYASESEFLWEKSPDNAIWRMNKKNWYTIILDGSVPTEELYHRNFH